MKPFKVPSGIYEIPAEEVIVDTFQEAVDFTRNRPDLTYEFIFEKIEPEPFNPENIKKGLEQALEHAQNESIMRSMLTFVIKERRYLHRMWMIQERESRNSECRSNNFWVRWIEARIICKKLINIYRAK